MPLDYSKWKTIEISDDEDDTHPNIDTPSLFRWRHRARMERMEKFNERVRRHEDILANLEAMKKLIDGEKDPEKANSMRADYNLRMKAWHEEEEEIKREKEKMPWNVDTISREKFSKTMISKAKPSSDEDIRDDDSEEAFVQKYSKFVQKHEADIKHYGMLRRLKDTQRFLCDHPELVCESTANYLVVWCIDLEMEEKHDLMGHVARQAITLQFILELAKTLDKDPRSCVRPFFSRLQANELEAMAGFTEELVAFKERVRRRAKEKFSQLVQEAEEKERQKRLGPGGLDPVEVMETLPPMLQKCFETRDVELLREVLTSMPKEDAQYHLDRCIKSGLWVPAGKDDDDTNDDGNVEHNVEQILEK